MNSLSMNNRKSDTATNGHRNVPLNKRSKTRRPKIQLATLAHECSIANQEAYSFTGARASCILTSAALMDVMRELGYEADPMRLAVSVSPNNRDKEGVLLGSDGDGSRRPAAGPGNWNGHLAIVIENRYLMDATID